MPVTLTELSAVMEGYSVGPEYAAEISHLKAEWELERLSGFIIWITNRCPVRVK